MKTLKTKGKETPLYRVLLIYRVMIPSIRLCGHCQMEYLDRNAEIEYRAVQEMRLTNKDLNWADIILLGRLDGLYESKLVKKLHDAGKYLIYIIDDDLLNIPPEISSATHYRQKDIQSSIRNIIQLSDAVMSPSPLLLAKYAVNGRKAIMVEEPAIQPASYVSGDLSKPIKIGFAGSIDRIGDIEVILKETLIRIKNEYGEKVRFEFFGAIPSFAELINAHCIPYCESYDDYKETLNNLKWDIGLAPMPNTAFHACKHYIKFIEYASAGILGVFSNVEPYTRLKTSFPEIKLCDNASDDWYGVLTELLNAQTELVADREKLLEFIRKNFSLEEVSKPLCAEIKSVIKEIQHREVSTINTIWMLRLKISDVLWRARLFVKKYGIKAPIVLSHKYLK